MEKPAEVQEIIGQKRLRDKVSGILERIEKELDSVESKIGEAMHVLDTDNDGMVRLCACPEHREDHPNSVMLVHGIAIAVASKEQGWQGVCILSTCYGHVAIPFLGALCL